MKSQERILIGVVLPSVSQTTSLAGGVVVLIELLKEAQMFASARRAGRRVVWRGSVAGRAGLLGTLGSGAWRVASIFLFCFLLLDERQHPGREQEVPRALGHNSRGGPGEPHFLTKSWLATQAR